jgi:hypothetical protein
MLATNMPDNTTIPTSPKNEYKDKDEDELERLLLEALEKL